MKLIPKLAVAGLLATGFVRQSNAQIVSLPEVTVSARNYKYLHSVDNKEASQAVKLLERKAAS